MHDLTRPFARPTGQGEVRVGVLYGQAAIGSFPPVTYPNGTSHRKYPFPIHYITGDDLALPQRHVIPIDLNGDGYQDLIYMFHNGSMVFYQAINGGANRSWALSDFDLLPNSPYSQLFFRDCDLNRCEPPPPNRFSHSALTFRLFGSAATD